MYNAGVVMTCHLCVEAAAGGATHYEWASGELFGCGAEAVEELTQQLNEGVVAFGFKRVDWWRGHSNGLESKCRGRLILIGSHESPYPLSLPSLLTMFS